MTTLQLPENLFDDVQEANTRGSYPDKPCVGRYIVRINHVAAEHTKGDALDIKWMVKVNYTVLKVLRTEGEYPSHRVGDICEQVMWRSGKKYAAQYFAREMKNLMECVVEDLDASSMSKEEFKQICKDLVQDPCPITGLVLQMDNSASFNEKQLNPDGTPKEGARPWANVRWVSMLTADDIRDELDERTIEKFQVLETA